jgi:hypothetical protein
VRFDIDRSGFRLYLSSLETADVVLTRQLEEAHPIRHGLAKRAGTVPPIVIDAIGGDDCAGAVGSALAMNENGAVLFQYVQYFVNLRWSGWRETAHWNVDVFHPSRGHHLLFFPGAAIGFAQVNYGLDSYFGQVLKTLFCWLRSTIYMRIHLVKILDSRRRGIGENGQTQGER